MERPVASHSDPIAMLGDTEQGLADQVLGTSFSQGLGGGLTVGQSVRRLLGALVTVLRKELLDGGHDRRSIVSALVPLALVPLMLFVGFQAASRRIERERDIAVPIVGAE